MDSIKLIEEAAEMTRLSVNTLRWMRQNGTGPRSAKLGRRIVYREQDIKAWIDAQFEQSPRVGA